MSCVFSHSLHRHHSAAQATFTPSIQPNVGLPRTRPPLNSAVNNRPFSPRVQTISILSDPLYSLVLFLIELFYSTLTKLLKKLNFKNIHFPSLSLLIPHASAPYNAVCTITLSYRHFFSFFPNPLLLSTPIAHSPRFIPLIYFLYETVFTSSICCHLRPHVLKTMQFL